MFFKPSRLFAMSGEKHDVKRLCVENDSQCHPSTNISSSNSPPHSSAPIKSFRDLIFSISGTMPAVENAEVERNTGPFGGKRKLDQNVDDSDADANADNRSCCANRKEDSTGIVNESDVGITEYISEHDGFSGILKQR